MTDLLKYTITVIALVTSARCSELIAKDELQSELHRETSSDAQPGREIWDRVSGIVQKQDATRADFDQLRSIAQECELCFKRFLNVPSEQLLPSMRYFVNQFGIHGRDADLGWILSCTFVTLPYYTSRSVMRKETNPNALEVYDSFDRAFVEIWLERPAFRAKYYTAMLWARRMFGSEEMFGGRFSNPPFFLLEEVFTDDQCEEYWWNARRLLLYIHATSQDRLLLNAEPQRLHAILVEFIKWGESIEWSMKLTSDGRKWEHSGSNVAKPQPRRKVWFPPLELPASPFDPSDQHSKVSHEILQDRQLTPIE